MKQRITIEQVYELPDMHKRKLVDLWKPERGDMFYNLKRKIILIAEATSEEGIESSGELVQRHDCLPLLSIGQMIELIESWYTSHFPIRSKGNLLSMEFTFENELNDISVNRRIIFKCDFEDKIAGRPNEEYADVLWRIVKNIL